MSDPLKQSFARFTRPGRIPDASDPSWRLPPAERTADWLARVAPEDKVRLVKLLQRETEFGQFPERERLNVSHSGMAGFLFA